MPTAISYSRSSSASKMSIDGQDATSVERAAELGLTLLERLSDPSSASRYATKARANWRRLVELTPTVDVVILPEPSRGDRTLVTWIGWIDLCRDHGTKIHAIMHQRTYDPRIPRDYRSLAEDGVDAAYESDKIAERTRRGKLIAFQQGRPSAPVAYGYTRVYDTTVSPPRYVREDPHPDQAAVVTRIITRLAGGDTLYAVVQALTADQVPTPRGADRWWPGTVRRLAASEVYRPHADNPAVGRLVRQGTTYPGTWPPLVDEPTWQAAQATLATHDDVGRARRKAAPPGAVRYLLSGHLLLLTSPCGGPVMGAPAWRGRQPRYCCAVDGCAMLPMAEADEAAAALVCARLAQPDQRDLWVADDAVSSAAAAELQRLVDERAANDQAYRRGEIPARMAGQREAELVPLIEDAERRARPAGVPLGVLRLLEAAAMGAEHVRPAWDDLPLLVQRETVAAVLDLRILPIRPGARRITRWTEADERLALVAERVSHRWRAVGAARV